MSLSHGERPIGAGRRRAGRCGCPEEGGAVGTVIVVTCEACGQTWHWRAVSGEQLVECIFCGRQGRLQLGPGQLDRSGTRHVEAWLHSSRASAQ